jgi:hypothetical protein
MAHSVAWWTPTLATRVRSQTSAEVKVVVASLYGTAEGPDDVKRNAVMNDV